ncbi:hypothetical protein NDU88_006030 [Pleurodeles waltl]|uniref:Uncharacterized protein n=1 Tax=Pleurodeles waltl TaxID=8319 RepID=A0AAV7WDM2_PLEWA|nr:hypothetical protein NDU88_006030 [Pleurodeles waltl]
MDGMPRGDFQGKMDELETLTAHTAAILQAIKDTKITLEAEIGAVAGEVGLLREDQWKIVDRVKETEGKLETMVLQVKYIYQRISIIEKKLRTLVNTLEDTEGRSHHHNVCLVGMPEREEGLSL